MTPPSTRAGVSNFCRETERNLSFYTSMQMIDDEDFLSLSLNFMFLNIEDLHVLKLISSSIYTLFQKQWNYCNKVHCPEQSRILLYKFIVVRFYFLLFISNEKIRILIDIDIIYWISLPSFKKLFRLFRINRYYIWYINDKHLYRKIEYAWEFEVFP